MKLLLLTVMAIGLAGCCSGKSDANSGKKRIVTLYAADGHIIQTWIPDGQDNFNGGWAMFRVDGERVKVTGTIVSEIK
jgi:hypothetical protein